MTTPAPRDPADLSLILALFRCTDTEAKDEAMRLADLNCRDAGQRPYPPAVTTPKLEKAL